MSKISIRFFNDREVRAINDEEDYVKAGNYWRWLKKKFASDGVQLVSVTHEFKFEASDGKKRAADALDTDAVQILANQFSAFFSSGNHLRVFFRKLVKQPQVAAFTYSDNTIDGKSKKKAYEFSRAILLRTRMWARQKPCSRFTHIFSASYTTLRGKSAP